MLISNRLVDELRQHKGRNKWAAPGDLVFPHSDVRHVLRDAERRKRAVCRPENLRRALMPFAEEADVPWLGFHAFRHGFASALVETGRNVVLVSRLLRALLPGVHPVRLRALDGRGPPTAHRRARLGCGHRGLVGVLFGDLLLHLLEVAKRGMSWATA